MVRDLIIKNKKILILVIIIAMVSVVSYSLWYFLYYSKLPIIDMYFTPQSSLADAEGKKLSFGKNRVSPGKYKIRLSKQGFTSAEKEVEVKEGDNIKVELYLISDSTETEDWYKNNPKDQEILQTISSHEFAKKQEDYIKNNPILNLLPATGKNFTIKSEQTAGSNKPSIIIIVSDTGMPSEEIRQSYRNEAINWLKSRGINTDEYFIRFIN